MRFIASVLILLAATATFAAEPKRLLLVGQGPDSHPKGTHEYMAGVERIAAALKDDARVTAKVVTADEPWADGPGLIDEADAVVIFVSEGARWVVSDPRRHDALARLAARGGGLATLHWGMGTRAAEPIEPFLQLFGGCHGGPDRKYQIVEEDARVYQPHPVTKGIRDFRVRDEFYYRLKFVRSLDPVTPLIKVKIDGELQTVAWAWQRRDGGRSFGFSGLHFDDNWRLPEYQKLIKQAVLWTLKLDPATAKQSSAKQ